MVGERRSYRAVVAVSMLLLLLARESYGQEQARGHSCTVDAAYSFTFPKGDDGHNFKSGWGVRGGGGFAVSRNPERHGFSYYITANYMYSQSKATAAALEAAKMANPTQLMNATSAHGSFSAVTIDPTARFAVNPRLSLYGLGGFGWFRRGVGFNGANPATLIQPHGDSLDRLSSNSGVFDFGGGANFGTIKNGGLMLFAEIRWYQGTAINSGTSLVPLSVGVRW